MGGIGALPRQVDKHNSAAELGRGLSILTKNVAMLTVLVAFLLHQENLYSDNKHDDKKLDGDS
uniref:Uncharacterized protein n=1 Tax=Vibrio tasmaniensis TaxID=212663 RepID=A0A0H3ZTD9_9VIBR|nr:hypothetical protein [Vibrio tasmaniensis]